MSIFSSLYEWLNGVNADYPEYRSEIFRSVGIISLLVAFAIGFLFYIVIGRWRMIWFNNVHWTVTISFAGAVGFLLAFAAAKSSLGLVDGYLVRFAIINAVFTSLMFILLSFLFKPFSVFSKRTPF